MISCLSTQMNEASFDKPRGIKKISLNNTIVNSGENIVRS